MKKIVAILLAAMMLLGCVACGEKKVEDEKEVLVRKIMKTLT